MTDNRLDVLVAAYRSGDDRTKERAVDRLHEQLSMVEISLVLKVSSDVVEAMLTGPQTRQ